jgi:hypothetical protein
MSATCPLAGPIALSRYARTPLPRGRSGAARPTTVSASPYFSLSPPPVIPGSFSRPLYIIPVLILDRGGAL